MLMFHCPCCGNGEYEIPYFDDFVKLKYVETYFAATHMSLYAYTRLYILVFEYV